jgi:hypothetical protein
MTIGMISTKNILISTQVIIDPPKGILILEICERSVSMRLLIIIVIVVLLFGGGGYYGYGRYGSIGGIVPLLLLILLLVWLFGGGGYQRFQ